MVQTLTHVKHKTDIERELANASLAQGKGNAGMARVCARRAAGWSIQIWLERKGVDLQTPSAFDYIKHLREQEDTPEKVVAILNHLIAKAEHADGSEVHVFPVDVETFLAETRWLCEQMLEEPLQ